jgi:hypothetical protein
VRERQAASGEDEYKRQEVKSADTTRHEERSDLRARDKISQGRRRRFDD